MPENEPITPLGDTIDRYRALCDALARQDLPDIARRLENSARATGSIPQTVAMLHAAATYRLVVAQEQTAYLLQRLVDATEQANKVAR